MSPVDLLLFPLPSQGIIGRCPAGIACIVPIQCPNSKVEGYSKWGIESGSPACEQPEDKRCVVGAGQCGSWWMGPVRRHGHRQLAACSLPVQHCTAGGLEPSGRQPSGDRAAPACPPAPSAHAEFSHLLPTRPACLSAIEPCIGRLPCRLLQISAPM